MPGLSTKRLPRRARVRLARSPAAMAPTGSRGDSADSTGNATFAPTPGTVASIAEPAALGRVGDAVELGGVLPHHGFDQQARGGRRLRQGAERAGGGLHHVAAPLHAEHAGALGELPDAAGAPGRLCGKGGGGGPGAAAGTVMGVADRHRQRVRRICSPDHGAGQQPPHHHLHLGLVAPPVPTTASFTDLAAYSVTGTPASAGASRATPRA